MHPGAQPDDLLVVRARAVAMDEKVHSVPTRIELAHDADQPRLDPSAVQSSQDLENADGSHCLAGGLGEDLPIGPVDDLHDVLLIPLLPTSTGSGQVPSGYAAPGRRPGGGWLPRIHPARPG